MTPPPSESAATLLVDARCTLGEGLVWCTRRRALLWTDIEGARLWMHVPASGATRAWVLPDRAGAFALCASGRVLLGLAKGLAFADIDEQDAQDAHDGDAIIPVETVAAVEADLPRTRVNDGRTDRAGAFVFGTMNEDHADGRRVGRFYQFSSRHGLRPIDGLDPIAIANSICFSLDGGTMYYADSPARRIMQADYDSAAARVTRPRVFVDLADEPGIPDGSVIDADGGLWNAVWGAGRLRRYSPAGVLDREILVAAPHTTCPAFGGPDLGRVFTTSARAEMDAEALARFPLSGGVFQADPGVRGLTDALFPDA